METYLQKIASFAPFLVELAVYTVFALGYFFLALNLIGAWLRELFDDNRILYAMTALALILAQGVLLEMFTSALLRLIQRKER